MLNLNTSSCQFPMLTISPYTASQSWKSLKSWFKIRKLFQGLCNFLCLRNVFFMQRLEFRNFSFSVLHDWHHLSRSSQFFATFLQHFGLIYCQKTAKIGMFRPKRAFENLSTSLWQFCSSITSSERKREPFNATSYDVSWHNDRFSATEAQIVTVTSKYTADFVK